MRKLTTKHDDMWLIMHIEVHLLHGVGPKIFAESATTDRSNFQRLAGSVTIDRNNYHRLAGWAMSARINFSPYRIVAEPANRWKLLLQIVTDPANIFGPTPCFKDCYLHNANNQNTPSLCVWNPHPKFDSLYIYPPPKMCPPSLWQTITP